MNDDKRRDEMVRSTFYSFSHESAWNGMKVMLAFIFLKITLNCYHVMPVLFTCEWIFKSLQKSIFCFKFWIYEP